MKKTTQEQRAKVIPLRDSKSLKKTKARRKRKKKKGFWTKPRVIFLLAAAIVLCLCFLPIFNLQSIVVEGNANTPEEKVLEAVSVQEGNNIFRISTRKIRKNVSSMPYVESVKVKRKLPATLIVEVKEYVPMYQMAYMGEYLLLSEENIVLEKIPELREGVPELIGLTPKSFVPGEAIAEETLRLVTTHEEPPKPSDEPLEAPEEATEEGEEAPPPEGEAQEGQEAQKNEEMQENEEPQEGEEPQESEEPEPSQSPEEPVFNADMSDEELENILVLAFHAAKECLAGLREAGVYEKIQAINVTNPYQILLTYNHTLKIDIGDTENLSYKFDLMKHALDNIQDGERGTLIVSASGRATFKPE